LKGENQDREKTRRLWISRGLEGKMFKIALGRGGRKKLPSGQQKGH